MPCHTGRHAARSGRCPWSRWPCSKGSDSHRANDEVGRLKDNKSQPTNRYWWIKADPTFSGLKQITNEPKDRVYIGRIPPKLEIVHREPTRSIEKLAICKSAGADVAEAWFDCKVPLGPDMEAITGNKGSGKSALADIIALSGNAPCDPKHFSILIKNHFCERSQPAAVDQYVRRIGRCRGRLDHRQRLRRRLIVLWSGAEIVRLINVSTDVIRPSVWRTASLNAVRSIRLLWMAASVYRACPLGAVVCQHSSVAFSIHNVRLPRPRRPASSAS